MERLIKLRSNQSIHVTPTQTATRVRSIDILRGAIMVLMAIDHVRVYSGMPAGGPEPGIFFTRWVTHFCVSGFVFFAGTGIFLYEQKLNDPRALTRYLLTRGLWLIFLELIVIRFFWEFNLDLSRFILAGVIWMLGCCMILMSALIKLPFKAILVSGLVLAFGQQLFHYVPAAFPGTLQEPVAYFWNFFYPTGLAYTERIAILYVLIPWIGVMAIGYAFGKLLLLPPAKRNKCCYLIGGAAITLFLIIGTITTYHQSADGKLPFVFRLLNQRKYPASILFLLMTLGPLIALVPFAEWAKGWLSNVLSTFGRVPLFYYLVHILLIHLVALLVNLIRVGNPHQDWYGTAPFLGPLPEGDRWGLPVLYLVFFLVEVILYLLCRWFARFKTSHPGERWLKYL
jgi:uncharacterized membrane protein